MAKGLRVDILLSGFGGQGIMSLGHFLSRAAMNEGKYTVWFPSYGAEVRGGTAHCFVKISDAPVASPFVERPDVAMLFNQPSLDKFQDTIKKGGLLILNGDLSAVGRLRRDLRKAVFPLSSLALTCGNIRVANTMAMGVLISRMPHVLKRQTIINVIKKTFPRGRLLDQNLLAFYKGEQLAWGP